MNNPDNSIPEEPEDFKDDFKPGEPLSDKQFEELMSGAAPQPEGGISLDAAIEKVGRELLEIAESEGTAGQKLLKLREVHNLIEFMSFEVVVIDAIKRGEDFDEFIKVASRTVASEAVDLLGKVKQMWQFHKEHLK